VKNCKDLVAKNSKGLVVKYGMCRLISISLIVLLVFFQSPFLYGGTHSLIGKYLKGSGGSKSQRSNMDGKPEERAKVSSITRILVAADTLISAGKPEHARRVLQKAVKRWPSVAKIRLALALTYERTGDYKEAMNQYKAIISFDTYSFPAIASLGYLYVENNLSSFEAKKLLKKALDINPDCGRAFDGLGWLYYKQKKDDRALKYFEKAKKASPDDPSPLYHLGLIALRHRKTAKALTSFQQVVELDSSYDKAWISLGILYMQMRENRKAVSALNRAYILGGNDSVVSSGIRDLLRKASPSWQPSDAMTTGFKITLRGFRRDFFDPEDFHIKKQVQGNKPDRRSSQSDSFDRQSVRQVDRPVREINQSKREQASSTGQKERLSLLPDQGDIKAPSVSKKTITMEEAMAVSEGIVQQNMVIKHMRLGRLYYEYALMREAASEFQTVINISPLSAEAREAKELVVPLADFEEPSKEEKIEGYFLVAAALFRQSDNDGAVLQYQKVLLIDPDNVVAHKNLAYIYLKDELIHQAWSHIQQALTIDPEHCESLILQGFIFAKRRNFAKAKESFYRASKTVDPDSVTGKYAKNMTEKMSMFTELR